MDLRGRVLAQVTGRLRMRSISFGNKKSRSRRGVALTLAVAASTVVPLVVSAPAHATTPPGYTLSIVAGTGTSGATTAGPASTRTLGAIGGTFVDPAGNLYLGDIVHHQIYKVTPAGALTVFAGNGTAGAAVAGPATASPLSEPFFMAMDPWGDLYVSDYGTSQIYEILPNGVLSVFAGTGGTSAPTPGPALNSALAGPGGIAVAPNGTVYVSAYNSNVVVRITKAGQLTIFAGTGNVGQPTPGAATSSNLSAPDGLALDPAGNVYIADSGNDRVEKVTPNGVLSIVAGSGVYGAPIAGKATLSPLKRDPSVALDSAGNLYISDSGNGRIEKVTPAGVLSIIAGTGNTTSGHPTTATPGPALASDLDQPYGIAVDPAGNIYVPTIGHPVVVKLAPPRVPGKVGVLSATRTSATTVTAKLKPGPAGTSPINSYQMACKNAGGAWHYGSSTTTTVKVTTLKAGPVACIARAHNLVGYGPWSTTFNR